MAEPRGGQVAVVDDEEGIRETVGFALRREGYRVETFADGLAAWDAFRRRLPDLVVLDILMPRLDGLELCRRLRAKSEALPIIFLTSRDEELDRVLGLELGADDYICKPFSPREVVARVKAVLRRTRDGQTIEAQGLVLDEHRYRATLHGRDLELTAVEFKLLKFLAANPGRIYGRQQLMDKIYPDERIVSDRTIDSHIKKLRRKIEAVDAEAKLIHSVYGVGYKFEAE